MNNKLQIVLNQGNNNDKSIENKSFKTIVAKLEKIKVLEEKATILDEKLITIKQQVAQITDNSIKKIQIVKENHILLLIDKYKLKSLTKWQKEILITLINEEIELLDDMGILTDKMKGAYQDLKKLELENMSSLEKEFAAEMVKKMMKDLGMNSEEDFNLEHFFEDDFATSMNQKIHEENHKREEENNHINKEIKNKKTDLNFQKIYKNLIKKCHPDLSKTKEENNINDDLTKRLTIAWQNRDYYELLILWTEIDPNNSTNLEINEENQKSIIKNLNNKILHLEHIDRVKKFHDNNTAFYYKFNSPSKKGIENNIKKYNITLLENIQHTENLSNIFKKTNKLKEYLAEIYDLENDEDYDFEDESFNDIFFGE